MVASLTIQAILSTLTMLTNQPKLVSKIESLPSFETTWNANLDLAVALSKDTRISEVLDPTNWKKLSEVSHYHDVCTYLHKPNATKWQMLKEVTSFFKRNDSPLVLFRVLKEILVIPSIETIVKLYPQYKEVLVLTRTLAISITENFGVHDMTPEVWKKLLEITRMEITGIDKPDCETVLKNCTATCDQQMEERTKYLEFVTPDLTRLFKDLVITSTDSAMGFLQLGYLLKMPFLVEKSSKVLENGLSIKNAVQIFQVTTGLSELKDLNRKSEEFILREFEEIYRNDFNFTSLTFSQLNTLLISQKVNVSNEFFVFEAIVGWVNADLTSRKVNVVTLMKSVRLGLISLSELNQMVEHKLLAGLDSVLASIRSTIELKRTESSVLINQEQDKDNVTIEAYNSSSQHWI